VPDPLVTVAATGDRAATLEAVRDLLALALDAELDSDGDGCRRPHAQMSQLAKQLADVMREIDTLRPQKGASARDEIAAKRDARRAGAALSERATRV
jgi:outer membrane murein-binding lipoprotein Lpp